VKIMDLGNLVNADIKLEKEDGETRSILFRLRCDARSQPVEFRTTASGAMFLMKCLQELQARHKIPIPQELRPSGPPTLSIVTDDENEP